jgi:hypothetical protein
MVIYLGPARHSPDAMDNSLYKTLPCCGECLLLKYEFNLSSTMHVYISYCNFLAWWTGAGVSSWLNSGTTAFSMPVPWILATQFFKATKTEVRTPSKFNTKKNVGQLVYNGTGCRSANSRGYFWTRKQLWEEFEWTIPAFVLTFKV